MTTLLQLVLCHIPTEFNKYGVKRSTLSRFTTVTSHTTTHNATTATVMSGHRSTINDAANNRYTLLAEEGGGEAGNSSDNSGAEDKTPVNEPVVRIAAKPGPKLPAAQQHGSAATNTPPNPWVRVDRARRGAQQNDMHQPCIMTSTGTDVPAKRHIWLQHRIPVNQRVTGAPNNALRARNKGEQSPHCST